MVTHRDDVRIRDACGGRANLLRRWVQVSAQTLGIVVLGALLGTHVRSSSQEVSIGQLPLGRQTDQSASDR